MWRLAAIVLLACGDPPAGETAGDCTLSPIETWMEGQGEIGLSEALVARLDRGTVFARPLRSGARPVRSRLERAHTIFAIEPIGGDRHALLAFGSESGLPCLVARAISADGRPLGAAVSSPIAAEELRTGKLTASGARAYYAWSADSGERALESWRFADGSLVHETHALGEEPALREMPVEILALGARGAAWAVIWRRGPTEATESQVFLTTHDRHAPLEALHEALAIDAISVERDRVNAIATFEFSRPHLLALEPGAAEPISAEELPAGASSRGFRVRAELDRDAEGLWLRRRTAAGDPIGDRMRIAEGDVHGARIAGDGRRLVIAWRAGDRVMGRRVVCR